MGLRVRHPLARRLLWSPLVGAVPLAYLGYMAYLQGFPPGRTAVAGVVALWFGLAVFDTFSSHRVLDWLYSDEDAGAGAGEGRQDDAVRFRKIISAYGGKPGRPSAGLLTFLRGRGVSEAAIAYLAGYVLEKSAGVGAIDFYAEDGWLGANAEDFVPIAVRDGLLIVGSCPNGDPVAVDVRDQLGAAGYIGHETMWQAGSVREVFAVLAPGLGALAAGLRDGTMPLDYYVATRRGSLAAELGTAADHGPGSE
jgi:hypothetical protein